MFLHKLLSQHSYCLPPLFYPSFFKGPILSQSCDYIYFFPSLLLSGYAALAPLNGDSLFPRATLFPIIVVTLPRPLSQLTKVCLLPIQIEDKEEFYSQCWPAAIISSSLLKIQSFLISPACYSIRTRRWLPFYSLFFFSSSISSPCTLIYDPSLRSPASLLRICAFTVNQGQHVSGCY